MLGSTTAATQIAAAQKSSEVSTAATSSATSTAANSSATSSNISNLLNTNLSSSIVGSVSSKVGSVTSAVSGVTSSISSTVTSAESAVSSVVSGVTSTISTAISGVSNLFNQAEKSVAGGVSDLFSGVFGDSSSSTAGAVNTTIPDALGTSLKGGTPKSQFFSTNAINSQMSSVNLSGQTSTSTFGLESITGDISTLASRFGTSVSSGISGITSAISTVTTNSSVSGLYSDLKSAVSTVSSVETQAKSAVSSVVGTISSTASGAVSDFENLAGGIAQSLTGSTSGLNSLINTSLPLVTGSGTATQSTSVGSNVSSSLLTSLYSAAKSAGCEIADLPYTAYSATQNLYGALVGITSQLNMTDLLRQLLNCSDRFDSYGSQVAQQLFISNSTTNPSVASILGNAIGSGKVAATRALTTGVVTNPNLTSSDTANVNSILSTMGSGVSALQTGDTVGTDPIWDASVTSATPSYILDSLSGSTALSSMTGGTQIDTSSSFASI